MSRGRPHIVYGHDIRMVEAAYNLSFLQQASFAFYTQLTSGEYLNGYITIQQNIASSIDSTHVALTDLGFQIVTVVEG